MTQIATVENAAATESARHDIPQDRIVDFNVLVPSDLQDGFHQSWHKFVNSTPHKVVWTNENEGHWIVKDGALLHRFFDSPEMLSSKILFVPRSISSLHKMIPTTIDAPEHTPYRKLLNNALSPRTVRGMHEKIRAISEELIDAFADRGHCDFISEYSSQFPIRVFMALVELPKEDIPQLKYWCDAVVRHDPTITFEEATAKLIEYVMPLIEERAGSDRDDLLTTLLNGEVDGKPISVEAAARLVPQVLVAGLDTVVNILGFVWHYLALDKEAQAKISQSDNRSNYIEEIVRRFPMVSIARLAAEDIEVDGITIRKDDVVAMPTMVHSLDETANKCPMKLDFDRREINHTTFGNGPHRCPGAHLARNEILITLDSWFARIPAFEIDPDFAPKLHGGIVVTMESLPLRWDVKK